MGLAADRFFLSAGAALAGFHTRHRPTDDLDFFTHERPWLAAGEEALRAAVATIGATVERVPLESFSGSESDRRLFTARRSAEVTKVDLVCRAQKGYLPILTLNGIAIDSPLQILANKLMILDYRPRDLKDIRALERKGFALKDAVDVARTQIGITPRELMSHFDQLRLTPDMPHVGQDFAELEAYRLDLIRRLARLAFPPPR